MTSEQTLCLTHDGDTLKTLGSAWREALKTAQPDPVVKIRHAALDGNELQRRHVASIPDKVGCHFHAHGDEKYMVVAGQGLLHWGKVTQSPDKRFSVHWEKPLAVKTGDSFVIPEGYAHQLQKTGAKELAIVFECPDSHLQDTADRTMLPDATTLKKQTTLCPNCCDR